MHRFIVPASVLTSRQVQITGPEAFHLYRVLRLPPGERIEISDGEGRIFLAELVKTSQEESWARIIAPIERQREPSVPLILGQALVKGDKMDLIVQKGTELGVYSFAPFISDRVVVKVAGEKASRRRERWQRIAAEGAKQCGRPLVPRVEPIEAMARLLGRYGQDWEIIMPWEDEKQGLRPVLEEISQSSNKRPILVLIGPEGGFSPRDVELARSHGARVVSLGPRILRTETAALAVVTMILYHLGDLGE